MNTNFVHYAFEEVELSKLHLQISAFTLLSAAIAFPVAGWWGVGGVMLGLACLAKMFRELERVDGGKAGRARITPSKKSKRSIKWARGKS